MDCCIDAKVKMIYLQDSDDIIDQYIGFCRVCNEQVALNGRTLKAEKEIIRICRDRNLLKEYLSERETEVEEIMLTLFDQEYIWNLERDSIRSEAFVRGASEKQTQVVLNMFRLVLCQDLVQHKMRNFNYFQLTNSDSLATLAL